MQRSGKMLCSYIQRWSIIKKISRKRLRWASSRCLCIWPSPFGSHWRIGKNKIQNS
jgi:hypothetical protein